MNTETSLFDFFISHSSENAEYVHSLCMALEERGSRCWIAPRNIGHGRDYISEILLGVDHSESVVVLVSDKAGQSKNVANEIHRGQSAKPPKPVVPVFLSNAEPTGRLWYLLNFLHRIEAEQKPHESVADEILEAKAEALYRSPSISPGQLVQLL